MLSNNSFKLLTTLVLINILSTKIASEEIINDGFLQDINKKLQSSVDDLFSCIGITEKLRTNMKTEKIFLSMLETLTNNSKKNSKSYEKIVNETKIEEYKSYLPDINDILKDVLVGKMEAIYNSLKKTIPNNPTINGETVNVSRLYNRLLEDIKNITTDGFRLQLRRTGKRKVRMKTGVRAWKPSQKQINGNFTRRIYRSTTTNIHKYPFMASIHWNGEFICGGSIISKDLILSAASCLQLIWNNRLYREFPNHLAVRVGSTYVGHSGELIQILEVYFHPDYNPKTLQHNLVVLRMGRQINFPNKSDRSRIKYIDFNRSPTPLATNVDKLIIVGWGANQIGNRIHEQGLQRLSMAALPYFDLSDCKDIYSKVFVTNYNFCAGFITIGTGACNRDVGNPVILDDTLIGVVSFGAPVCGTPNVPTVLTKIGFYVDWLETILELRSAANRAETTTSKHPDEMPTTTAVDNKTD